MRKTPLTVATIVGAFALAFAAPAANATPTEAPRVTERLAGADRFATAVAVSASAYPDSAPVVYLTSGVNFPDALSAGPVAATQGGPVLLTKWDQVPAVTTAELKRLSPKKIVLVGGTSALAPSVEKKMMSLAPQVVRVAGADRYDTSRRLAEATFTSPVSTVYLATGKDYPDALSAGAAAGTVGGPVLLVDGDADRLDAATQATVKKLAPGKLVVAGGPTAVSDGVLANAMSIVPVASRVAGSDRFETSAAIGSTFGSATHAYLASGWNYPDALVGSALAGKNGQPLYVIMPTCQPAGMVLGERELGITELTIIGGTHTIRDTAISTHDGCSVPGPAIP
ncbi:cell wall-binding repeat-containing protein [Leifsonia sp. Root227]|uniref:cell wall-binding repeat-containing protein n=1 Tax=Leifsonia sp. Root227 TaxID=1736496 RepID=UPI00138F6149|nr:cell wall-binding repeat-containing protein [Leifsonia sp. Root227]